MHRARHLFALALPLALTACASSFMPDFLQVYKMDIHQGNILDEDKVKRLRLGMSENEVRFLLGSPMLVDVFHQNRWDYVYYNKPGKDEPEQRRLTLFFEAGQLARIEPPLDTVK
ncbi:MAG: outer membrane protein assembly factor BamE [Halothiobacillaceae bacterium]